MLKISSKLLYVVENLLEILFNHCQNSCKLNVSHPRDYVVGDCVVLVTDQDWEFDVKAFHHSGRLAADRWLFTKSDLPMRQQTFH